MGGCVLGLALRIGLPRFLQKTACDAFGGNRPAGSLPHGNVGQPGLQPAFVCGFQGHSFPKGAGLLLKCVEDVLASAVCTAVMGGVNQLCNIRAATIRFVSVVHSAPCW